MLLIILLISIALTACSQTSDQSNQNSKDTVSIKNTYEFKDKNNTHSRGVKKSETVKVPKNPERVAVLDYGALDIMQQMGLQSHVKAVAKGQGNAFLPHALYEFKSDQYINLGNPGRPKYDNLAKSKPDLILASFRQAHTKTLDEMKKAAPDAQILFVSPNNDSYISSIETTTQHLGKIFDKKDKANKLNRELKEKVNETKRMINKDKVLLLVVDDKGMKAFGQTGRFGGFLNKDLGIQHADNNMKANSAGNQISYEYLNKINPDKLFVINRTKDGNDQHLPKELNNKVIKNIKAIKNHNVYQFKSNAWYFGEGGHQLTIDQLEHIQDAFENKK
ncbi:ABC transporter substrate-binding protein [Staphylococcus warneri]|uniref:ABC transporter substrate-binding protein n=1 Tax=Staphylococcus warneri TaxID=1292 RepID=UPI000D1F3D18|nr:ABC transporter substrate-binding protein [Staphylococcus warneri]PTI17174.1 transferrin-binding protein [Staphylococcus warneri]